MGSEVFTILMQLQVGVFLVLLIPYVLYLTVVDCLSGYTIFRFLQCTVRNYKAPQSVRVNFTNNRIYRVFTINNKCLCSFPSFHNVPSLSMFCVC